MIINPFISNQVGALIGPGVTPMPHYFMDTNLLSDGVTPAGSNLTVLAAQVSSDPTWSLPGYNAITNVVAFVGPI